MKEIRQEALGFFQSGLPATAGIKRKAPTGLQPHGRLHLKIDRYPGIGQKVIEKGFGHLRVSEQLSINHWSNQESALIFCFT